ncbi:MAG TPA: hypothetical protein VFE63_03435 [Roseiarcus sp.]|jgi:hypothetical protein|nr:hypothetical protein [Roseiarcus sp.]
MDHYGRVAGVGGRINECQRPVRGRFEIVGRREFAGLLLQNAEARVGVRKVELPSGRKHGRNHASPDPDIGEPADCPPGGKHQIEQSRRQAWSFVHGPFDESGLQTGFVCELSRDVERCARKVDSGDQGPPPHEAERVAPDVALQMEDALSRNIAEFGGFDRMKSVISRTIPVEHVVAGYTARMDRGALVPIQAIDLDRIEH